MKKKTDRKFTEAEWEFHHFIMTIGMKSLLRTIEFVTEHPESRLKELIRPFDSQEEYNHVCKILRKDPKTKFEYDSIVTAAWKEMTGKTLEVEGGIC